MSRFAFITIAIIRLRFVSITNAIMKILCKYIFIVITIIIIIIRIRIKAETEQEKKKREEREERETYLGMRGHEPLLNYRGFNAFFYNLPSGPPEVATLSNTIDNGNKIY